MHFVVLFNFVTETMGVINTQRLIHASTTWRHVRKDYADDDGMSRVVKKSRGWRHITFQRLVVFMLMILIVATVLYCCCARDSPYIWAQVVEVLTELWQRTRRN